MPQLHRRLRPQPTKRAVEDGGGPYRRPLSPSRSVRTLAFGTPLVIAAFHQSKHTQNYPTRRWRAVVRPELRFNGGHIVPAQIGNR